jgi:hypothetical protein
MGKRIKARSEKGETMKPGLISRIVSVALGVGMMVVVGAAPLARAECPFTWEPLGSGLDGTVRSLAVYGGELVA